MKNLWVISEFYWPVENATGYIITRIVDEIAKYNNVNVITIGKIISERSNLIKTYRVKGADKLDKNYYIQRLLKQIIISFNFFWIIIKKVKKGDTLVTVTNPALILIFLSIIKKIKKIKLIIIVHDVFPENLVVIDLVREKSLVYKLTKIVFDISYKMGDLLFTLGRDMQKQIQKKVKNKEKVVFIPNFSDIRKIYPQNKFENIILQEQGLTNKFVILYTGNIGRAQGIDNLLKAIKLLGKESDIHFLFIGDGVYASKMNKFVSENNLTNTTILPNMGREKEFLFLNAGDIGLVSLVPNVMGTGVPSKTYSYIAAGKPILAVLDDDSEIALMVKENNIGWVVNPDNPEVLASFIKTLKNRKEELILKSKNARKIAKEKYSLDIITREYAEKIISL